MALEQALINFVQLADVSLSTNWICSLCVSKLLKMNKNRIVVSFEDHRSYGLQKLHNDREEKY